MSTRRLPMLPSASKSDLAAICTYPWNSGVRWPKWEPERIDARFGKAFHAVAEAAAHVFNEFGGVYGSIMLGVMWCATHWFLSEQEREQLEAITHKLVEQLASDTATWRTPEVIFALNVDDGTVRVANDRRDKRPNERLAIADLVVHCVDGGYIVREYKTGRGARQKKAATSAQTRLLAFAAARFYDLDRIRCEVVHVAPDGFVVDAVEFDALALCVIECEQEQLIERLLEPPVPVPGPWCVGEFCTIKADCPATLAMLAVVEREALATPVVRDPRTPEEAGRLRTMVQLMRAWCDTAEERWKAMAKRGPIPTGPDKVVVMMERQGDEEIVENDKTFEAIEDELSHIMIDGDEKQLKAVLDAAYKRSVSKSSIDRATRKALGPAPARGAIKHSSDRILNRLRREGLIRRGERYTVFTEVPANRLGGVAIETEGAEVEP